jgi:hypothetical protein
LLSPLSGPLPSENFLSGNIFLPVINGLAGNDTARLKANFLRTKRAYFFGSSADQTVNPWQSELLGFYGPDGMRTLFILFSTILI